jgi:hypothetical protein
MILQSGFGVYGAVKQKSVKYLRRYGNLVVRKSLFMKNHLIFGWTPTEMQPPEQDVCHSSAW